MRIRVKKVQSRNYLRNYINQRHIVRLARDRPKITADRIGCNAASPAAYLLIDFNLTYTPRLFIIIEHVTNFRYYLINVTTNCEVVTARYHRNERQRRRK